MKYKILRSIYVLNLILGGGGAALHHTAVVTDPVSLNPVVVEKVTPIATSGGIKTAGFGQIPSFGQRAVYRVGASQVPYGLSGLDYYSYPRSLLSSRRGLRTKTIVSDNLSGLSPIGYGRRSAIIADPTTSQFTVGDAQIRSNAFGGRGLYRTGLSPVPFGLSGLDYYSYPKTILSQRSLLGGLDGLGQTKILSGGGFGAGDAQVSTIIADPIGQEKVIIQSEPSIVQAAPVTTIVEDGFGQRQITTAGGLGGLRGGQIILRGGAGLGGYGGLRRIKSRPVIAAPAPFVQAAAPIQEVLVDPTSGLGAPIGGFGQRQVAITKSVAAPAPIIQAPVVAPRPIIKAPVIAAPAPVFQAPVFAPAPVVQAPVVAPIRRRLGESFLTQVARPVVAARRVAAIARPQVFSQPPVAVVQQAPPFPGNIQFTLGNTQIIGGPAAAIAPAPIYPQAPVFAAPRPVSVAYQRPAVVAAPQPVAYPRPAFVAAPQPAVVAVQRPVVAAVPRPVAVAAPSPVVSVKRPVVAVQQPVVSGVKTAGYGSRLFGRRFPQMVYTDGGSRYAGIDIIGGYRIGDPRFNYAQLPINAQRFANLGLSQGSIDAGPILVAPPPAPAFATKSVPVVSTPTAKVVTQEEVIGPAGDRQVVTTVTDAGPSKIGGPVVAGPLGLTGIGQLGGTKTVTQEEVIGPAGDSQIITTVTNAAPSKIGGAAIAGPLGLTAVGQTTPTKVVTQEEVIGPAGDTQLVTTVTETAGPSKIGGPVISSPLGLTAVGQAPTKVITQEEVVGPAGDTQVITTVSETSPVVQQEEVIGLSPVSALTASPLSQEIAQDPIGTAFTQATLGDSAILSGTSAFSPISQSLVDPVGAGQLSIADPFSSSGAVVKETTISDILPDGSVGQTVTKITEVSQQPIVADPISQQSISTDIGGGLGYVPRVSFLSSYPYDVPDRAVLRQVLTRPIVQEQQQLEQILVK